MAYRGQGQKVQKVMVQPIVSFFSEGFDEYMNLVLDDSEEIHMKTKNRKPLGRIMLKGDNITLLQSVTT
uniref:Small nuclear ribonucleoprotein E n=1 Tax=Neogobius melanostomus TaxID=47308 RepID=A0A8C6TE78_9GOBI